MRTTHGSPLFTGHVPDRDELVVERMRAAGAITIGKTNTPEFAAGSHTFLDWMRSCYLVTMTGSPALSVPAGFTPGGLPVGLQIVGPHLAERRVLEIGHAFERATGFGARRPPL